MVKALPHDLAGFRDFHRGTDIIVCGCGSSLNELRDPQRSITIGVNDVGRLFDPDYLVVLNPRKQFRGDRFRYVEQSRARAIFTQLSLRLRHPHVVQFRLGKRGGSDLSDPKTLPFTRNSPYVALCLAIHMGATRIGLIGVDFTDDHFFAGTGRHPLASQLPRINEEYGRLAAAAARLGVEVVNLSSQSRLTVFPKRVLGALVRPPPISGGQCVFPEQSRPENSRMKVAIEKHKPGIVGDFLDALAASARQLGHSVVRYPLGGRSLPKAVSIVWNGRHHRALGPTLYCEHAWLPRWDYQISPNGINADSHIAPFVWDGVPLSEERLTELDQRLEEIRQVGPSSYSYMQTAEPALTDLPEAFLLVPLQMAFDTNIQRHVPSRFRSMQALVDHVTAANPPYPIIFKQHPADLRRGNRQLNLRLERKHDSIRPHGRGNIHQYLKSGRCKGVVALNSNVVHDGLLWDLDMPVVVLGRNIWPRSGPTPFLTAIPSEWDEFEKQRHCADTAACRRAYAHYLTRCQWTLDQARDPGRVQALLAGLEGPRRPPTTRTPTIRIRSEPRLERINLCARNQKWFFEDLKRHFVSRAKGRFDILATETPVRGANAWIFIRTKEAAASPDPERTLVQVHDMFDQRLYRPGGERACVRRCEALMLTHPDQKTILGKAGVPLAGKRVLCRPIGALEAFSLRNALTDRFTFAWVGRPASHRGRELKRADWFVEAAKRLGPPCRAVLLGERLENHHKILRQAGVDSVYLDRKFNSIETYPEHYKSFDCIVVTSLSEAGPLCLFEALATGVPVISTPVGWAPRLIRDGQNGYIAGSIDEIVEALRCIRGERAIWLQRREAIRESLNGYTLESWVDLCLETAADLTRKPRPRSSRRLVKLMGAQ